MHMRRVFPCLLALALALDLCGCGAADTLPAPMAASAVPAALPEGAALRALDEGTAAGRYMIGTRGNGDAQPLLYWVDYAAARVVPLCAAPNCAHDSDACTAWLPPDAAVWVYAVDEDTLLKNINTSEGFTLYRCHADGSDPQILYTTPGGSVHPRYTDGTDVWCMATLFPQDGPMTQSLLRLPLAGGKAQTVAQGVPLTFLGCCGRSLVLKSEDYSGFDAIPEPDWSAAATEEERRALQERYDAALKAVTVPCSVQFLNADTGEITPFLSWQTASGEMSVCLWQGDTLYRCQGDGRQATLQWDRTDGTGGSTGFTWPIPEGSELSVQAVTVVAGQLILRGDWYAETGAVPQVGCVQLAIDPAGGARELTMGYLDPFEEMFVPLVIRGRTADSLLVQFEQQAALYDTAQTSGVRWGLITFDDFLANRPNYREIDQSKSALR